VFEENKTQRTNNRRIVCAVSFTFLQKRPLTLSDARRPDNTKVRIREIELKPVEVGMVVWYGRVVWYHQPYHHLHIPSQLHMPSLILFPTLEAMDMQGAAVRQTKM
jgi:hypothetical protein